MDSVEKLQAALTMVEEARGVPLSASCVLHRGELMEILVAVERTLPRDLAKAQSILASRDQIVEEGRLSGEQLVAHGREEVSRMVESTSIVAAARKKAEAILDEAREAVEVERKEVDAYIDSRLATLEVILNKTLDSVERGRERLAGASDKDILSTLGE